MATLLSHCAPCMSLNSVVACTLAAKHFYSCHWYLIMVVSGAVLGSTAPPWHLLEGAQQQLAMHEDEQCLNSSQLASLCSHKERRTLLRLPLVCLIMWWSLGVCLGLQHLHSTFLKGHSEGLQQQSLSAHCTLRVHEECRALLRLPLLVVPALLARI